MKGLPILFTGEMVRAILDGRKTQTRRVIKGLLGFGDITEFHPSDLRGYDWRFRNSRALWNDINNDRLMGACPYGQPGDRLWVREKQRVVATKHGPEHSKAVSSRIKVRYEATGTESKWLDYPDRLKHNPAVGACLPYGGFRESSRITLEVAGVRVERVQEISEADAIAEGIKPSFGNGYHDYEFGPGGVIAGKLGGVEFEAGPASVPAQYSFMTLWNSINQKRGYGWDLNPWVWCVEFKKVEAENE